MWGNYFGNYVCCKKYFGSESGWSNGLHWYNPGFFKRSIEYTGDLTISEVFSCLKSTTTNIDKLKAELKNYTNYDSKIDRAYGTFEDWP